MPLFDDVEMPWPDYEYTILGLKCVQTCPACPEQYDVYRGDEQVGYLRLRHGEFRADVPKCGGKTVFKSEDMLGDGMFTPTERAWFLTVACTAILRELDKETDDG